MGIKTWIGTGIGLGILAGCAAAPQVLNQDQLKALSGGDFGTVFNDTFNAYSLIMPGASATTRDEFQTGRSFFRQSWVTAGNAAEGRDGLGPIFNEASCAACHFRDGRAEPFQSGSDPFLGLLLRLSVPGTDAHGGPLPEPTYGDQLQDVSISGAATEGTPQVSYTTITGQFADGEPYELQKPTYTITGLNYGAMQSDVMISPRMAQPMIGLGLLEDIPETEILAHVDENDSNNDGISGKANRVWDVEAQQSRLGRFGWKANQPSIRQQVAGAFLGDIGITSSIFPNEARTAIQSDLAEFPSGGEPELSDLALARVTTYVRNLAVPGRRNVSDATVALGERLFYQLNCTACHLPQIRSSSGIIRPFTDLLLHDMGDGLADNRPDFLASGREWRTAPLWGIGLLNTVNGHTRYLHDGRARNLQEAILWHGGEAEAAKEGFKQLPRSDRAALLAFLNSL